MAEILIPKFGGRGRDGASVARALCDPKLHKEYIAAEKAKYRRQAQKIFQRHKNRERRKGSEFDLEAVIPARTFFRWMQTDPHFWEDDANVKKFIKDNPEVKPWK